MAVAFHHTGGDVTGEMVNTVAAEVHFTLPDTAQGRIYAIIQLWATHMHTMHTEDITYTHASCIFHDQLIGPVVLDSEAGAGTPGGTTQMMPLNVAVIIQKTTAFAGRKFRGRLFIGGFSVSQMDPDKPNKLKDATIAAWQVKCDNFRDGILALDCFPSILHQEGGPSPTRITSFDVHPLVATMRKRIR
jgi:hypothetical protein